MIFLLTDFGLEGPYLGQMEAVILGLRPDASVINLFPDLPRQNPRAASYLLPAYSSQQARGGAVFLCVVDPAVGSDRHKPVMLLFQQRWYLGPHNGLFDALIRQGAQQGWLIRPPAEPLSATFHGRDLYAPAAARLDGGSSPPDDDRLALQPIHPGPDDLAEIVYIDGFGNAITGLRQDALSAHQALGVAGRTIHPAPFYSAVARGDCFWYPNSNGLIEIAVNQGSAAELLGLKVGDALELA